MSYFSGLKDIADRAGAYLEPSIHDLMRIDYWNPLGDLQKKLPQILELARKKDPELKNNLRKVVSENFTWDVLAQCFVDHIS